MKYLSFADIQGLTPTISKPEIFLHTKYNGKEYAGVFNMSGDLLGLCEDPYHLGEYTDEGATVTPDMEYILEHPDNFQWWFVDVEGQQAELCHIAKDLLALADKLDQYKEK